MLSPVKTKLATGKQNKQVPYSMAIENMELARV